VYSTYYIDEVGDGVWREKDCRGRTRAPLFIV